MRLTSLRRYVVFFSLVSLERLKVSALTVSTTVTVSTVTGSTVTVSLLVASTATDLWPVASTVMDGSASLSGGSIAD